MSMFSILFFFFGSHVNHVNITLILIIQKIPRFSFSILLIGFFFCTLISWLIYKRENIKEIQSPLVFRYRKFYANKLLSQKNFVQICFCFSLLFSILCCLSFALNVVVNGGILLFKQIEVYIKFQVDCYKRQLCIKKNNTLNTVLVVIVCCVLFVMFCSFDSWMRRRYTAHQINQPNKKCKNSKSLPLPLNTINVEFICGQ